jgi:glycosyltransferase involved in cell wall biosynthesis
MRLSVVVPVYNNVDSVGILLNEVETLLQDMEICKQSEIVFVDDGSTDGSLARLIQLVDNSKITVKVIKLAKNFGQVSALYAGYKEASGDCIVTISADLQDPTLLIKDFYREFLNGFEVVIGNREQRNENLYRKVTSSFAYRIAKVGNPTMPRGGFDYFLISARVKNLLIDEFAHTKFIQGALMSVGLEFKSIGYTRASRPFGKSGWTFNKKARLLMDILFESSTLPLRVVTLFGGTVFASGFALLSYVLYGKLSGNSPFNGFALIFGSLLILNGLIFIFLGVISEYLIILFSHISGRNRFTVESKYIK